MGQKPVEVRVAKLLSARGGTLSVAESCTGGLLGHRLTEIPGSSRFFAGGVVAYSYEAKERLLKVDHDTLVACGAVSKEIAMQMARGVRMLLETDYALSITGIAGPGGGMPGKPVGLTYIALDWGGGTLWRKHIWRGDRSANKQQSAGAALSLLEAVLLEEVLLEGGAV